MTDESPNIDIYRNNVGIIRELISSIHHGGVTLDIIPSFVKRVIKEDLWRLGYKDNEVFEFKSFEHFVTSEMPEGMGTTIEQLEDLCRTDSEAIALIDEVLQKGGYRQRGLYGPKTKKSSSTKEESSPATKTPRGVSSGIRSYYRRIRENRPDLYEEVKSGKKKIRVAAREAGYLCQQITFLVNSPEMAAAIILKAIQGGKASKDFIKKMCNIIISKIDSELDT